jgi:hypothetical protein
MKTKASLPGALSLLSLAAALSLGGCAGTDVVAKVANSSFKSVIDASAGRVAFSEKDGAWALASAAGDQVLFSSDFSAAEGADVTFSFEAAPFLAAGLDPARLSLGEGIKNELKDGRLVLRFDLGKDTFAAVAKKSPEATFAEIVRTQRKRIGYHEKLDHYGIKLGGGNMFEWAKDMATNDKDTVWVLNPAPFIAAGVDPVKVAGWVFAKVESKDANGKTQVEDKLLKPFNLR